MITVLYPGSIIRATYRLQCLSQCVTVAYARLIDCVTVAYARLIDC